VLIDGDAMQVLGISGSMRKDGNTSRLITIILRECEEKGLTTEYISLSGKNIHPCIGCETCKKEHECAITDDDWEDIASRILDCEVLVIGSPTYYYDVSGQLKNFIDRTYSYYHDRRLAGRKAVAVSVEADKGGSRTIQTIEGFLSAHEFSYMGHVKGKGYLAGDVLNDADAIVHAKKIGDKIARFFHTGD
jgi:multimeric flavodoxin WrbA